jgi:hypothetical protein
MQKAYKTDPTTLEAADPNVHAQFIEDKIRDTPRNLAYCHHDFPGHSPECTEFVKAQLVEFSNSLLENQDYIAGMLAEKIPGEILEDEGFAVSWFQQAGLPMTRDHSALFSARRDILLLVAEHCGHLKWKQNSFNMAPAELLDDVFFIGEVMNHEPTLFVAASERIRNNNFELAMVALSRPLFLTRCRESIVAHARARESSQGPITFGTSPPILSADTLMALFVRAESSLILYHNFANLFLGQLHFVGHDTNLHQAMSGLNQLQEIKMIIGDFVGYTKSRLLRNNMHAALAAYRDLVNQAEKGEGNVGANYLFDIG